MFVLGSWVSGFTGEDFFEIVWVITCCGSVLMGFCHFYDKCRVF